jgi:hypothetical protein
MHQITHPTKEQVRAYMTRREVARVPPPAPDEVRRELGWRLQAPATPAPLLVQLCLDLPICVAAMAAVHCYDWLLAVVCPKS